MFRVSNIYDAYKVWSVGLLDIEIYDRFILTSDNKEAVLKEIWEIEEPLTILPVGNQFSMFPPMVPSNDRKVLIVDLSLYDDINFFNDCIRVCAGACISSILDAFSKKGLGMPVSPPAIFFESIGGLFSSGILKFWYNMPYYKFVRPYANYLDKVRSSNLYGSYGSLGIITHLDLVNFISWDDVVSLVFDINDLSTVYAIKDDFFSLFKVTPRYFNMYFRENFYRCLLGAGEKLIKVFYGHLNKRDDVFSVAIEDSIPVIIPEIDLSDGGCIYLVDIDKFLVNGCRVLFGDIISNKLIVLCSSKDMDIGYERKVIIESGVISKVEYRDVSL